MENKKIFCIIPQIAGEIGFIGKDRSGMGYKYRGIDDALAALQPLLAKYGVCFSTEVLSGSREERQSKSGGLLIYSILDIATTFYADDGSFLRCVTRGEAMDSGDKSSNKCMSAALKYAIFQTFCIPTFGSDADTEHGEQHQPKPKVTVFPDQPAQGDGVHTSDSEFVFPLMAIPLSYLAKQPISKVETHSLKQVIEVLTAKYGKSTWPVAAEGTVEACYAELDKRGIK